MGAVLADGLAEARQPAVPSARLHPASPPGMVPGIRGRGAAEASRRRRRSGGRRRVWVDQWHEGRTSFFPAACFLPQEFAEGAVAAFLAGRDPSEVGRWEAFRWDTHKRELPPPDGLVQWLFRRRPVLERAAPTE